MILGWSMERILLQRIPRGFWVGSSIEDPGVDSAIDSDSDLMMTILGWILKMILCRIFYGGSSMEDSGVDSAMDSDSDLMMMDSGVDSGVDSETDSSVEDSVEDSGVDSGMDLMKSRKVIVLHCVFNTFWTIELSFGKLLPTASFGVVRVWESTSLTRWSQDDAR